jgi:hypothetical protein
MAALYQDSARIQLPYLTQVLLQDRAYTAKVDPLSEKCRANPKYVSIALSTGIQAIQPWPGIANAQAFLDRSRLVIEDMVSYHVEIWSPVEEWDIENDACSVYGLESDQRSSCVEETYQEPQEVYLQASE